MDELLTVLETPGIDSLLELLLKAELEVELTSEPELLELGVLDEELGSCDSLELLELVVVEEVLSAVVTELELL